MSIDQSQLNMLPHSLLIAPIFWTSSSSSTLFEWLYQASHLQFSLFQPFVSLVRFGFELLMSTRYELSSISLPMAVIETLKDRVHPVPLFLFYDNFFDWD